MKLAFAMFDMPRWHEDRDQGACFEHLYATLYGYSFCFDPYLLATLDAVPEFVELRHLRERLAAYDVLVSPQRNLTAALHDAWPAAKPALWVDPPPALALPLCEPGAEWVTALRERLRLAEGQEGAFLRESSRRAGRVNASGFWPFAPQAGDAVFGRVGERPVWMVRGNVGYASINHLFRLAVETIEPGNVAALATAFVRATLTAMGEDGAAVPPVDGAADSLRRDFHAFGATRELLAYGYREAGHDPAELAAADEPLLAAARAAVAGDDQTARIRLGDAFRILHERRERHFPFDRGWIDIPHSGILIRDIGAFELEWPELTRDFLAGLCDLAETRGYRFCIEYGSCSLQQTARRHPETIARLARLWAEGKVEIVNGSWTNPLQQFTDIELAAREFELGTDALEAVFGRRPESYSCQEFSLMPSFPGLLRDFGYKRAAHVVQLRGQVPETTHQYLLWEGKDGRRITALGHHALDLCTRGNNFYIEWPNMFIGCLDQGLDGLDSCCDQDQGVLPFREEMIRAGDYAPVLGQHRTLADVLPEGPDADLPVERFAWDEYTFEKAVNGPISSDWISLFEQVLHDAHRVARAEMLAAAGNLAFGDDLRRVWEWVVLQQSHDNLLCPRATAGDFYYPHLAEHAGPHFNRETDAYCDVLMRDAPAMAGIMTQVEESAARKAGLQRPGAGAGSRLGLHNPFCHVLGPSGSLAWSGPDFTAAGDGVRLVARSGRIHWCGNLAPGAVAELEIGAALPAPSRAWEFARGVDGALTVTRAATGQAVRLHPVDGRESSFALGEMELRAGGARAQWHGLDARGHRTTVVAEFVDIDAELLHLCVQVADYRPLGEDKDEQALRLRFTPTAGLDGVQYFVSHFVEPSRKRIRTSSPYLTLAETPAGTMALCNRGSLWHQRGDGWLDAIVMVPHETVPERHFALGWDLDHPVTTAVHQLDEPLLAGPRTGTGRPPQTLSVGPDNVWASSWRPDGQLRISETEGRETEVVIAGVAAARSVTFRGERGRLGETVTRRDDGAIVFTLKPYESAALTIA